MEHPLVGRESPAGGRDEAGVVRALEPRRAASVRNEAKAFGMGSFGGHDAPDLVAKLEVGI